MKTETLHSTEQHYLYPNPETGTWWVEIYPASDILPRREDTTLPFVPLVKGKKTISHIASDEHGEATWRQYQELHPGIFCDWMESITHLELG